MFSTQQDLEPRRTRPLSRRGRPISCLGGFQHALGHSDAECAHLFDLELANVDTAQDRSVCYLLDRRAASLFMLEYLDRSLTCRRACIASILRLIYLVFLTRTKDYTYTKVQSVLWSSVTFPNFSLSHLLTNPQVRRDRLRPTLQLSRRPASSLPTPQLHRPL